MDIALTPEENKLLEHAKEAIVKHNKIRHANGGIGTLYSFILSDGWTFPMLEKYTIGDFFPLPFEPPAGLWDNWQPQKS